jgi:hypothetical protein
MFFRVKPAKNYRYLQIAQSVRLDGKVRQQVLATLGRLDVLEASGQLERLLRSGLKYCEKLRVVDAQRKGELAPVAVRKIGPDLVFGRLWEELGLGTILNELLDSRNFDFSVERAVYLTVLHRLFVSGSDRAAEKWRDDYRIPGAENIELHQLYRAMGWLGGGQGRSPSRYAVADRVEEKLFDRGRDLFSQVDLVFFDTTSIYFEGAGGQSLGQHGYSKDHRPDLKQMVVGLGMDVTGRPLFCQMWPGNTADSTTLIPVVEAMRKRFCVRQMCVVADRGMVSKKTLEFLERCGLQYIVGVKMRRQKEVSEEILPSPQQWVELVGPRHRAKDPSPLKVKEVWVEDRRYVVCLNEEEQRKDAHDREATVAALREALKKGDKSLVGNKGYRRYLKVEGKSHFGINEAALEQEARYDGIYILRTNTDHDLEVVANAYKMLWQVETGFRTAKTLLETRPIYHKLDSTIRGHVFCSFLALCLKFELEKRLRDKGLEYEWADVIRGLDHLQEVEVELNGERYLLRSQLTGNASEAVRAVGVAAPPSLRQAPAL